jgi:hypothetical protein
MNAADQYFSSRIHSEAWISASEADKTKALATAERQITTLRLRSDIDGQTKNYAIYEQALFLLSLNNYDRERQRVHALGVIGGSVGEANEYSSAEIVRRKMDGITICPEARSFLAEYLEPARVRMGDLR